MIPKVFRSILALVFVLGLGLTVTPTALAASPIYVRPGGDDTNCDGTADADYPGSGGPGLACAVATIQKGIDLVDVGGTVNVSAGTYVLAAQVNVNKAGITLNGAGAGNTIVQVSSTGYRFYITASGVTLQGFEIEKTDKTGEQNIIYIGASNVSIKNNLIFGKYAFGDGEVSRAFEVAYGSSGLNIEGNTIHSLRQPGYLNGSLASPTTGTITDNTVYGTRGWVLAGAAPTFTGNAWSTGNTFDIVILSGTDASYYPDIVAVSAANNDAVIEDQRVSPAVLSVVYVDVAAAAGGNGGQVEPYQTIAAAITRVVSGGKIKVAAGTYYESNLSINKSLTILGDPGDTSPGPGTNAPIIDGNSNPGDAFRIANGVSNVTIQGFEMRNFTSPELNGIGNGVSAWVGSTSNITIQDNYFRDLGYNGVLVGNDYNSDPSKWGDHTNWLIKGNIIEDFGYIGLELTNTSNSSIEDNKFHLMNPYIGAIFSSARRTESGLAIKNNLIDGSPSTVYPVIYMYAYDLDMANPNLDDVLIEGNMIATTGTPSQISIRNFGTGTITGVKVYNNSLATLKNTTSAQIDASANWWGTSNAATVKTAANGGSLVDYTPWLDSGTDTSTDPGFQGDFSVLWVDDDSPQTGTTGRIQEGINLVSGSTVNVVAGTYIESNILVDKSMTIQGAGATRDDVIVVPAAEDANVDNAFGSDAQNGFVIKANDVTIKKLTLNGRGNSALTDGKNNFRIGIVTADSSYPGGGGGTWNNLHVDDMHIKYPYRRGISVFPNAISGTLIENSRVDNVALNHGMYVAGQSQVLNNTINHAFQGIVVALDTSTPAGLVKINGNTLTDIGNFPGCWGYNAGTGVYSGQPRAIQFNNSDSAGRQVEIKDNVISDNGLEEYGGAVGIYTRLANSDSVVEDNVITLTSGVSWAKPGSQAVGMLLGWSYNNGFLVKNNQVNSTKYGIGVMIFGNGTADKPLTLEGNTITSTNSDALDTGDGTGIYIANQYLFASDKNPSYVILQNGNTISGFVTGIGVEKVSTSDEPLTVVAHGNTISGNTTAGVSSTGGTDISVDATLNWWGSACGPGPVGPGSGDKVSTNVLYSPWWTDASGGGTASEGSGGELVIPAGATTAEENAILACAAGKTVMFATSGSPYPGGMIVNGNGTTIQLNGATVGPGSPAFTINADDVTILGPGVLAGTGSSDPGILVNGGADNFILDGVEVKGWADGVQLAGSVTSFKLVKNWIHSNTGAGLQVDSGVSIGGVVTIEGNLFKVNGGNGVQNDSGNSLNATLNSWGADQGPTATGGDGVSANVVYDPWTFAEVYIDVDPAAGDQYQRNVDESTSFNVALNVDGENLYGLSFEFTYDPNYLTFNAPPVFVAPWAGNCFVYGTPPANTFSYQCYLISGPAWNGGTVATFNFTANGPVLAGNGPWTTYFDISHLATDTSAGAVGGVKVFVNNAGFNDPSTPNRGITDANDGQIDITGIAQFTGFVDLQGRANDSGAVVSVYGQQATSGATLLASGSSASSGSYTTEYISPYLLTIGTTYYFQVDGYLYLPTTVKNPLATDWAHFKLLSERPATTLGTVVLLGGDATNDDEIDITDATCVGGRYGLAPAVCGTNGWADVNGDGKVDILDLTLVGGNFYLKSSPWTP